MPAANITDFFDKPRFSDVTILIEKSGEQIHAHRVVLANESKYFEDAFEGEWKEAGSKIFTVKDLNPEAIKGRLAYPYGLYYNGRNRYSQDHNAMLGPTGTDPKSYIQYLMDLHIAAEEYKVATLLNRMRSYFYNAIKALSENEVAEVARAVFVTHGVATTGLRRPLAECLAWKLKMSQNRNEDVRRLKHLMSEIPELSIGITVALVDLISNN